MLPVRYRLRYATVQRTRRQRRPDALLGGNGTTRGEPLLIYVVSRYYNYCAYSVLAPYHQLASNKRPLTGRDSF